MTVHDPLLKTQQVAEALGVSVSTIKRWVDAGLLRASRTVGKHRLVAYSEALRFAGDQKLPTERLKAMASIGPTIKSLGLNDRTAESLIQALGTGDTRRARSIIHSAYAAGRDAAELADQLIRPVMERIGSGWAAGTVDVYQEHQATQAVASALTELAERLARSQEGLAPLALGATPEGDPYTLPLTLGELVIREAGWNVRNLGPNLPLRSLGRAAQEYQPRLIFLSVSQVSDVDRFVREYEEFYNSAAGAGAAVMIGGRALGPDLRARLVYAGFGDRLTHLSEFARRLAPSVNAKASYANAQDGAAISRNG